MVAAKEKSLSLLSVVTLVVIAALLLVPASTLAATSSSTSVVKPTSIYDSHVNKISKPHYVALKKISVLASGHQQRLARHAPGESELHLRRMRQGPGMIYFRARFYDPSTGEFTSRDPLEYVDGMSTMRAYMQLESSDPFGLCFVDIRECEKSAYEARKEWKFMLDHMKELGCSDPLFPKCINCTGNKHGTALAVYLPPEERDGYAIEICANRHDDIEKVKISMWHEMVHAYDDCRFGLDDDCEKTACTEVRAYSYSVSCNNHADRKQCVRDAAVRSTSASCPKTAVQDVGAVFDKCYLTSDDYRDSWLTKFDDHWHEE